MGLYGIELAANTAVGVAQKSAKLLRFLHSFYLAYTNGLT
jgi:hypothetical protein